MTDKEKISYLLKCNDKKVTVVVIWRKDEEKCEKISLGDVADIIGSQQAEIERLCIEIDDLIIAKDLMFDEAEALIKKARAEAIKEFVDKVKERKERVCAGHGMSEYVVSVYDIDETYKEMVGEQG